MPGPKGVSRNGQGWIHAAGSRQRTAVGDVQIVEAANRAPFIERGGSGIRAEPDRPIACENVRMGCSILARQPCAESAERRE